MPAQELCLQPDVSPIDPRLDTIPKNFLARVKEHGDRKIAMRKKRYGIWQEYTWQQSYQHVHDFALGLMSLGLQRGDKMAVIGENDPEYYWAEYASLAIGATTVGVFTDAGSRELEYVIHNSDIRLVVAHDQEQVDKMLELRERVPQVIKVVYWDNRGLFSYDDDWLMSFAEVEALGKEYARQHPGIFEEEVSKGTGEDMAIFSYTSGTTGLPKAAMIKHISLLYGAGRHTLPGQHLMPLDDYVSFSPMAWIAEQGLAVTGHVIFSPTINFPEKPETVQLDIRDIAPQALIFPSRLWESMVSQVQSRMADSGRLNRFLYRLFLGIGYRIADMQDHRETPNILWRILGFLGDLALYAPLRDKLGLGRVRLAYTGGAALSPDILRFFKAINIKLLQLYGSTECQTHTVHPLNDQRLGTVGQPPPGVHIKITEEGEIAVKTKGIFAGYYKAPDKTAEVVRDGWYHTGDAGYIDEHNHLIYLDRLSDMLELAGGQKFSPQYIEGRLKFSPYIQDVMAVGSIEMPYVSTLITLHFDSVARWAEKQGIAFTTMVDLSQKEQVYNRIEQEVERVNKLLTPGSRIRKFVILHKVFDADESELTRTRKLRRRYLEQRYEDILRAVYSGKEDVRIQSEVVYQDGRTGKTENTLLIRSVGDVSDLPVVDIKPFAVPQEPPAEDIRS
jgi:long-chain acyl-CoA synthetase